MNGPTIGTPMTAGEIELSIRARFSGIFNFEHLPRMVEEFVEKGATTSEQVRDWLQQRLDDEQEQSDSHDVEHHMRYLSNTRSLGYTQVLEAEKGSPRAKIEADIVWVNAKIESLQNAIEQDILDKDNEDAAWHDYLHFSGAKDALEEILATFEPNTHSKEHA